jgi:hypothetical protein
MIKNHDLLFSFHLLKCLILLLFLFSFYLQLIQGLPVIFKFPLNLCLSFSKDFLHLLFPKSLLLDSSLRNLCLLHWLVSLMFFWLVKQFQFKLSLLFPLFLRTSPLLSQLLLQTYFHQMLSSFTFFTLFPYTLFIYFTLVVDNFNPLIVPFERSRNWIYWFQNQRLEWW